MKINNMIADLWEFPINGGGAFKKWFLIFIIVVGVHCDIYRSSYNIS
jgi:hypothetical protein